MQDRKPAGLPRKTSAGPGRKPDPSIEGRVLDAAIQIYALKGWSGFNFDVVARTVGVGKAAIYRRWTSREELLADTFRSRWDAVTLIDEGSLEADLRALCTMIMDRLLTTQGGLVMNLQADAQHYPAARDISARLSSTTSNRIQTILRRSVERGEMRPGQDLALVSHMLTGTITSRIGRSADGSAPLDDAGAKAFVDRFVALLLAALASHE